MMLYHPDLGVAKRAISANDRRSMLDRGWVELQPPSEEEES